ncbi:MAG: hypothetical protein KDK45_15050, partial [Leptospiraceae bacterium]|nr:hypothetical protein [Leptospiraceae bacterium]
PDVDASANEIGDELVYNFEVEDNHTYFVTENAVLVHNYEKGSNLFYNPGNNNLNQLSNTLKGMKEYQDALEDYESTCGILTSFNDFCKRKKEKLNLDALKEQMENDISKTDYPFWASLGSTFNPWYDDKAKITELLNENYIDPKKLRDNDAKGMYMLNKDPEKIAEFEKDMNSLSPDKEIQFKVDRNTGKVEVVLKDGAKLEDLATKYLGASNQTLIQMLLTNDDKLSTFTYEGSGRSEASQWGGKETRMSINSKSKETRAFEYTEDVKDSSGKIIHKKGEIVTQNMQSKYALAHEIIHGNIIKSGTQSFYQNDVKDKSGNPLPVYQLKPDGKYKRVKDLEELSTVGITAYQGTVVNGKMVYTKITGKEIEPNVNMIRAEHGEKVKRVVY